MLYKLSDIVADICSSSTKSELHNILVQSMETLGFTSFNLAVLKDNKRQFMTEPTLTTWSFEDLSYYDKSEWYLRDPLLDYAVSRGAPVVWTSSFWDDQSEHAEYSSFVKLQGIKSGVTAPLLCHHEKFSAITLLSYTRESLDPATAAIVKILGEVAAERSCALGIAKGPSQAELQALGTLSEQQMIILDWARQGKSNADIALITGRSKRAVDYHMSEILRRLDVSSRSQAISIYCGAI